MGYFLYTQNISCLVAVLPIYGPTTGTYKNHVASRDRRLRQSIEPDSVRLPPFRHNFTIAMKPMM